MKTFILIFLLIGTAVFCYCYSSRPYRYPENKNTGVKWEDTLYNHLPANLDTTIIVQDANGTPLKFRQYIEPVFNHEAFIFHDRGIWRLQRLTESARDTLKKEAHLVARIERWAAFQPDTIKSWKIKLNQLAHIFSQADRVIVFKSKREMILQRKGITVQTFNINLGRVPTGKKEFDGDGKTPEGIYDLDFKNFRNDEYYKSMLISYPNPADQLNAKLNNKKPGMAVMIHGTKPNKTTAKDWTAGCIALQNKDMDILFDKVAQGTLIEIRK